MFAHQVIESLKQHRDDFYLKQVHDLHNCLCFLIDFIRKAQHFHLGDYSDLEGILNSSNTPTHLFCGVLGQDIRLPYKCCWFDFLLLTEGKPAIKGGVLALEITRNVIQVFPFEHSYASPPPWTPFPYCYFLHIDETSSRGLYQCVPISEGFAKVCAQRGIDCDTDLSPMLCLSVLNAGLILLNAKNIGTDLQHPAKKLNRKRGKFGKQELFDYHTLVLKSFGNNRQSLPQHLWKTRIHLRRGHFKRYTIERPLFARLVGKFWWPAMVAGASRKGIVLKDYDLTGKLPTKKKSPKKKR
jgi:hypothetical protein